MSQVRFLTAHYWIDTRVRGAAPMCIKSSFAALPTAPAWVVTRMREVQGALVRALEPFLGWAARRYQAAVGAQLKNYGLRYEDLLDPACDLVRYAGANSVKRLIDYAG